MIIGLENEHACNIATGAETARVLAAVDHPNLKVVWDPANAVVSGEKAVPEGYGKLPVSRIQHVHAKDCTMDGHKPVCGARSAMAWSGGAGRWTRWCVMATRAGSVWRLTGRGPAATSTRPA